jgi:hypothetical protein
LDPESVDLAHVARGLRAAFGPFVEGAVVARTLLRDEVVRLLACSQLEGENVVDTMVARGFLVQRETREGRVYLAILEP